MKVTALIVFTIFNLAHWYWGIFSDYIFTTKQEFGWCFLLSIYGAINVALMELTKIKIGEPK